MATTADRPPGINTHWNWQRSAACRGMDTEAFFHVTGDSIRTRRDRIETAKLICAGCPVRPHCLQHALETLEPYGIWGGLSEDERAERLGLQSLPYPSPRRPPRVRHPPGGGNPTAKEPAATRTSVTAPSNVASASPTPTTFQQERHRA